jgi:hypothetical protein
MRFEKGNKAATKRSKNAVAEIIRQRLETDGEHLTDSQFTTLVTRYNTLSTRKQRRFRKQQTEAKEVSANDYQWLTPEQNEIHRAVMQIEAEEHAKGIVHRRYSDGSTE